jgi:hypothetical protein
MANSELGYKSTMSFTSPAMALGEITNVSVPFFVQGKSKIISLSVGTPGIGVGCGYLYALITGAGAVGTPATIMTLRSSVATETATVLITYIL